MHPSIGVKHFEDRIPYWKKQGLIIKYLPPYSPELNLIEILWLRIKYTWLPFSAYACLNALIEALEDILKPSRLKISNYFCLGTYLDIAGAVLTERLLPVDGMVTARGPGLDWDEHAVARYAFS